MLSIANEVDSLIFCYISFVYDTNMYFSNIKAYVVDVYSYYIVCMIVMVWFPLSMLASDIGFPVYATRISVLKLWWAPTCYSMNILTHAEYTGTKPCWCAIAHQKWNFAEFLP